MFVYNEEARVADILRHAVQWADEVLILDKQSTDRTAVICEDFGPKVRVIEIPFTPQGHDDMVSACRLAVHDWIWIGTASEIPTRKVVQEAQRIVSEQPNLDLVYVPRKIYSFGCDSPDSPWGIRSYPFLINRRQALITNTIHNNFRPNDKTKVARITFADDCCVHHFTHATARSYLAAMAQYFEAESARPEQAELIQSAIDRLEPRRSLSSLVGKDDFGLECAWRIYWLGTALYGWEKLRAENVPARYKALRTEWMQREWPESHYPAVAPSRVALPPPNIKAPTIQLTISEGFPAHQPWGADNLLHALRDRPISKLVKTVYQIGAHRFQEKSMLFEIFPNLQRVVLFEPLPNLFAMLQQQEADDHRITVLPYAVSERNGETDFYVASNDGASSSILPFGKHKDLFPHVQNTGQITVQTRTLTAVMAEYELPPPDLLFLDVQGAEYQILESLSADLLHRVRMIYTEASSVEVYSGSRLLNEVEDLLKPELDFAGFCPLKEEIPCHGNALFVNRSQVWLLFPPEPPVPKASAFASTNRDSPWARVLRTVFSRKFRRSIRKRLAALSQALAN